MGCIRRIVTRQTELSVSKEVYKQPHLYRRTGQSRGIECFINQSLFLYSFMKEKNAADKTAEEFSYMGGVNNRV